MERALHPDFREADRALDSTGATWLSSMGASQLIAGTRAGSGREIPAAERKNRRDDPRRVPRRSQRAHRRRPRIDYLHLARVEGRWVIVNVLWALTPEAP